MTAEESFRLGFLSRCLESGMTPAEVEECVEKVATALDLALGKSAGLIDTAGNLAGQGANYALIGAAGIPLALGAGAGYLAGLARNKPVDVDTIHKQELIREYRRLARQAKDSARQRQVM